MKRILCLGDSNTFGYDPTSFLGEPYPHPWTELLHNSGDQVANCGQNGLDIATCLEALESVETLLARAKPLDRLLVMLGTNDILNGASAEKSTQRMEQLLQYIVPRLDGTKLLLIAPPLIQLGAWVQEERLLTESQKLCEAYCDLAEKLGVAFTDASAWDIPLAFDGVHFTQEGHVAFAEGLKGLL